MTAATAWLAKAWMTLPVPPVRLHSREVDGQLGPSFTPAFARILNGSAHDTEVSHETDTCYHPRLADKGDPRACPDCGGDAVHTVTRHRYRSPMASALARLSRVSRPSVGTPAPAEFVLGLAVHGWDWQRAAIFLDLAPVSADHAKTVEAQFLLAIRQLHSRYSEGPIERPSYIDRSESQRAAEDAA